jgi:nudix-type nucleoside diphosphatase (YffH/AdpP family)
VGPTAGDHSLRASEPPIRVNAVDMLYDGWAKLMNIRFEIRRPGGDWRAQQHLAVDVGDGVAVLPYDAARGCVLLARQFRSPAHLATGHGYLLEACAGKLDGDDPETCARREAMEELGYRLDSLERLFQAYSSSGALTERLTYFLAPYAPSDRVSEGGGHADEGEDIEVVETSLAAALGMVASGEIADAKTIILLQQLKLSGRIGP